MKKHRDYIISNLKGIKNQKDENYKVHCSMENPVNQGLVIYITSSTYGFSERGFSNKLKSIVYYANIVDLTTEDYYNLKYGTNSYKDIKVKIGQLLNNYSKN